MAGERPTWQWRDTGSGPGQCQRIAIAADAVRENRVTATYRSWITHAVDCAECRPDLCHAGMELWKSYRQAWNARRDGDDI
jgi:hypothetical protein